MTRQVEDCRKLAADRGWLVAEEYVDNDISAYSGKARPAYERMLADLADGTRDAVIVYNLDRLHRQPAELGAFVTLCERVGVTAVAAVTADIDLENDDGLFMARMFAAFAAKESGRRSARVRRKMIANAEAGLPPGGGRAFGYQADKRTIDEAEAAVIRDLVARYLAGESTRSLTVWLNEHAVPTVTGKPWSTSAVRQVISSERIAGLRVHRGVLVGPAVWPGIITEEQHRQVREVMDRNAKTGRRNPRLLVVRAAAVRKVRQPAVLRRAGEHPPIRVPIRPGSRRLRQADRRGRAGRNPDRRRGASPPGLPGAG